jgi:phosphatidylglycerophosphatase A
MPRKMLTEKRAGLAVWIATAGGAGYFPIAPGTAGSAVGVALVVGLARLNLNRLWSSLILGVAALLLFAVGVWATGEAEKFFARVDPGQAVIDEVVGQVITLLLVPHGTWKWLLAGFLLFRVFDIIKPFPARQAEQLPRGWGIMIDDVVAGLYGLGVLTAAGLILR